MYTINSDTRAGRVMINPFKKRTENTAKTKERKEKHDERRQRAQARGERPIK